MNDTMLQRLLWKEYRTQRGFWLGVAGMGLVLQLIVLMGTGEIEIRTSTLFYISIVMPVFYALGSTAMTFAAEREEETWNRLRILAASPGRLFLAKFGFSVVSTLMMAAVLVLLSWGMASGKIPEFRSGLIDSRTWMLAAGEFLVWGTFISLFTRRVLSAVFLTPVCALSFAAIASSGNEHLWTIRLMMMAFLLLASIGLSRRWLKRESLGWPVPWSISLRRKQADFLTAVETASPQKRLFQRLTWQERRQAQTNCFVFLMIGLPLVAVSYWTHFALRVDFAAIIISLVPLLCGVWVFRGEQEGKRFRYLTECGVTPQTVWLSKQRVWIIATLILVMLFVITDLYASNFRPHPFHKDVLSDYQQTLDKITRSIGSRHVLPVFILFCFTTYSIGQFVSMVFARSVTAAFMGFMSSVLFLAWLYWMLRLNVPLLYSVWPIPFVLLWATRVRSSDWMQERGGFKPWLRLGSTIIVPGILIVSGMIYYRSDVIKLESFRQIVEAKYRTTSIPVVRNSRRIFENALTPSTVEERETADMYRRASELMTSTRSKIYLDDKNISQIRSPERGWNYATPATKKWLEENQESLALILEASTQESCAFINPATATNGQRIVNFDVWNVSRLLLFSARKLESENKLDEAFKRYIASLRMGRHFAQRGGVWSSGQSIQIRTFKWMRLWMGHPQQTQQLLKEAIRQIRTETVKFPSPADAVTIELSILRRTFLEEPDVISEKISSSGEELEHIFLAFLWQFCPWERTRSVQLLELLAIDELNYFRKLQTHLDRRGIDIDLWPSQKVVSYSIITKELPWSLLPTTPLLSPFVYPHHFILGRRLINLKTRREATLLTLALIAYRKEHGELPQRLDQLMDEYFDALPLDPWSGREFGYAPEGFPSEVWFAYKEKIQAGQPLLWSSGFRNATIMRVGKTEVGKPLHAMVPSEGWESLKIRDYRPGWGMGIAFPIPE